MRVKEYIKNSKGITLVALVITIVIMIILLSIVIKLPENEEIYEIAENTVQKTNDKIKNQQTRVDELIGEINETMNEDVPGGFLNYLTKKPAVNNKEVTDALGNKILVPNGFKIVSSGTSNVQYSYYGDNGLTPCVQDGIVIEDVSAGDSGTVGNQFVWIPVGTIKNIDGTTTTINLGRYTFASDGTETKVQTATLENGAGNPITIEDSYQELRETDERPNGGTGAIDIDEFCKLAIANGGYYIGRYEASYGSNGAKALSKESTGYGESEPSTAGYLWNYINQTNAATASQNMYPYSTEAKVYSDLVNSFAWDTAIVFIQKYSGTITPYSQQNSLNNSPDISGERVAGVDKVCNIYDMASNVREWTTEYFTQEPLGEVIGEGDLHNGGVKRYEGASRDNEFIGQKR